MAGHLLPRTFSDRLKSGLAEKRHPVHLFDTIPACLYNEIYTFIRVKNNADAFFFTPDVCAAGRPKHPVIPSEKTPSRISPRVPLLRAAWSERVKNNADAFFFTPAVFLLSLLGGSTCSDLLDAEEKRQLQGWPRCLQSSC